MDLPDPTRYEPATPGYVFAVLRDLARLQSGSNKPPVFTECSTVEDWELSSDFEGWKDIAQAMNWYWELNVPLDQWKSVLNPTGQKPLLGACEFIAARAKRPRIGPLTILGGECLPAGAFVAIRSRLQIAGLDASHVTPSTPIAHCRSPLMAAAEIIRLAPGALPAPQVVNPLEALGLVSMLVGILLLALGVFVGVISGNGNSLFGAICVIAFVVLFLCSWALGLVAKPTSVSFGPYKTFGEVAHAIARGDQAVAPMQ